VAAAGALLAANAVLVVALAPAADARLSCLGRKATIASDRARIVGTRAPDVIVAAGGASRIDGGGGNDRICGGGGRDVIDGGRGSDRVSGGGGRDKITGFRGKDRLAGGTGNDAIRGDTGSDLLAGGGGRDRLFGDNGNDRLNGGPGARDLVDGGPGDEPLVSGGGGNEDVVVGGIGTDRIDGGPGAHDIASYATSNASVTIDLDDGAVSGTERERLRRVEDAIGGSGRDRITGSALSNRLDGGPGDDVLHAVGPEDHAYGGPGSDACAGDFASENSCGVDHRGAVTAVDLVRSIDGASRLVVTGGKTGETVAVARSRDGLVVSVDGGIALASGSSCRQDGLAAVCSGRASQILASLDAGDDVLHLRGLPAKVGALIDGGAGSDVLRGGAGPDVIHAGDDGDADALLGGGGNDVLFAVNPSRPKKSSGSGRMFGGRGNDLLVGGQPCEGDVFSGGPGRNDSASFARVRNGGIVVSAVIGGVVIDPDDKNCESGRIDRSVEKIEGSTGPDVLRGDAAANVLLGRGGDDRLDGGRAADRCVGGGGRDRARRCERGSSIP
jgi:serralysin